MKKNFLFLSVLLACSLTGFAQDDARIISLDPTLYYSFEKDDYKTPTVGATPLEYYKMGENNTIGTPWVEGDPQPTPALGPMPTKKAVRIPTELYLKITNPVPVEEGVSEFTLLWDISCPDYSNYHTLLQSRVANDGDGVFFVNKNGSLGHSTYSGFRMNVDAYYRVVLVATVDNYDIYVDGDLKLTLPHSKVTLQDFFWIFTDNDKECIDIDCANLAFWNTVLTPEDVVALGGIETLPYSGTPYEGIIQTEFIEAEFFDEGPFGMTYFVADQSAGGANNSFRQDVDLPIRNDEIHGDYIILKNSEFTIYTIDVEKTDAYLFLFNCKGIDAEGKLTVFVDNVLLSNLTIQPNEEWHYAELPIVLEEGQHLLKLKYEGKGEFDFADLFIDLASSTNRTPTYLYDFDDPSDLGKATIGDVPLEFYNAADLSTPNASGIQAVAGPTATKGAIFVDPTAVIKVNNPSGPTATGNRLDVYTILWDVKLNEMNDYNSFVQFAETKDIDHSDGGDGDLFTRSETSSSGPGTIGVGALGYSTVGIQVETWNRLIFTTNGSEKKIYLNGQDIHTASSASVRFTIGDFFWIFMDDGAERMPLDCSKFAFWADRALNIIDLGRAGFGGSPTAIKTVETSAGKVYAENGRLHVEGFSASASVEVYNLVGQKIAAAKSLNGNTINVSKGLYIVKVIDKGKSVSYKVIIN